VKRQISLGCGYEERERKRAKREIKRAKRERDRVRSVVFGHGMMVVVLCVLCFLSPHEALLWPASSVFFSVG
jgi:hypothetical protein